MGKKGKFKGLKDLMDGFKYNTKDTDWTIQNLYQNVHDRNPEAVKFMHGGIETYWHSTIGNVFAAHGTRDERDEYRHFKHAYPYGPGDEKSS